MFIFGHKKPVNMQILYNINMQITSNKNGRSSWNKTLPDNQLNHKLELMLCNVAKAVVVAHDGPKCSSSITKCKQPRRVNMGSFYYNVNVLTLKLSLNFRRCNANYKKKKQITKRQRDMLLRRPWKIADEIWLYNRVIGDFVSDSRFPNKVLLPNLFSVQQKTSCCGITATKW